MKVKVDNIEFISFSDGVCDIYTDDNEGNKTYKYKNLGFTNKMLGYNRVFAAKAAQVQANAVIRIPQVENINIHDKLDIRGTGKYHIELIQKIYNTNPLSMDLTLRQLELWS